MEWYLLNHWDQWFFDGFSVSQPLVTMFFNGCQPLVQRCDGNNTSFRLSTRTVHMIQYCYTLLLFFAFLTLFHFLFFNCVGSVNHQYQMSCSTFSFLHFFIKFYSSIEIDCCIFFLSEILVKNVLQSFLWIQDFIILGTQDPGILRSWKPRILGSWDSRILIS